MDADNRINLKVITPSSQKRKSWFRKSHTDIKVDELKEGKLSPENRTTSAPPTKRNANVFKPWGKKVPISKPSSSEEKSLYSKEEIVEAVLKGDVSMNQLIEHLPATSYVKKNAEFFMGVEKLLANQIIETALQTKINHLRQKIIAYCNQKDPILPSEQDLFQKEAVDKIGLYFANKVDGHVKLANEIFSLFHVEFFKDVRNIEDIKEIIDLLEKKKERVRLMFLCFIFSDTSDKDLVFKKINFCINILITLRKKENFPAVFAMYSVINYFAVRAMMKQESYQKQFSSLESKFIQIDSLIDPGGNYKKYREHIQKKQAEKGFYLPELSLTFSDLDHSKEGNVGFSEDQLSINLSHIRLEEKTVSNFHQFQETLPYRPRIRTFLESLTTIPNIDSYSDFFEQKKNAVASLCEKG